MEFIKKPTLGILRVVLALMVVEFHYYISTDFYNHAIYPKLGDLTGPIIFCGSGRIAVVGFFILSGYLVAEILQKRYPMNNGNDLWHFFLSRSARIYPLYVIVLTLTLLLNHLYSLPSLGSIVLNYTLIPYGIFDFFTKQALYDYTIISPTWSLPLDLVFYPIGAILLKSKKTLFFSLTLLFLFYLLIWVKVSDYTPLSLLKKDETWWERYFYATGFPNLFAFLVGLVARMYRDKIFRHAVITVFAVFAFFYVSFTPYGLGELTQEFIAIIVLTLMVNQLAFNGISKHEAFLGNWTYAIYLIHLPVIVWMGHYQELFKDQYNVYLRLLSFILSIIGATLLALFVEGKIEKKRKDWLKKWAPQNKQIWNWNKYAIGVLVFIFISMIYYFKLIATSDQIAPRSAHISGVTYPNSVAPFSMSSRDSCFQGNDAAGGFMIFAFLAILNTKRPLDKVIHSIFVDTEILSLRKRLFSDMCTFKAHPPSPILEAQMLQAIDSVMNLPSRDELLTPYVLDLLSKCKTLAAELCLV